MRRSFQLLLIASVLVLLFVVVSTLGLFSPVDSSVQKHQDILEPDVQQSGVSHRTSSQLNPEVNNPSIPSAGPVSPSVSPSQTVAQTTTPTSRQSTAAVEGPSDLPGAPKEDSAVHSTKSASSKVGFPGIKQNYGDIMLSSVRHIPGDVDDSFVLTFTRVGGTKAFDGSVWIIGEYRQRGTTAVMDMPSHVSIRLTSDGNPQNPEAGSPLTIPVVLGEKVSKKLKVSRPGFEGEELVGVRVGIYDRTPGSLHLAGVPASQFAAKKSVKRAKVNEP